MPQYLPRSVIGSGVLRSSVVPSPSWPQSLRAQHKTPSASVSAQVWPTPVEMAVTPLLKPVTATGISGESGSTRKIVYWYSDGYTAIRL